MSRPLPGTAWSTTAVIASLASAGCAASPPVGDGGAWGNATVVEEFSIGVESGADEYMFGLIRSLAVGADETIYVSDGQANVVRMYDSDGAFVKNIGRPGEGPGEYADAPGLAVLSDGRLVMRAGTRVSLFTADGEYLDSFPVVLGIARVVVDPEDNIHIPRYEGAVEVKYSISGAELEQVTMPPRDAGTTRVVRLWTGGSAFGFPAVETLAVRSPLGYIITGRTDAYAIELRKPGGTVYLRRDLPPPVPTSGERAEWEAIQQEQLEPMRERGIDVDVGPIAEVKPFFREIHAADDGRVWILRYVDAEQRSDVGPGVEAWQRTPLTWREPWTYDVFEGDGTFLGTVTAPEPLRPFVFRDERIWGAVTGEDGVERVVRLRVVPESATSSERPRGSTR